MSKVNVNFVRVSICTGLQTTEDLKFYGISAKFARPFSNDGKTLVVQFSVKHEQSLDCGGGYVKLFASDLDQKQMHGETPYLIMFGPDICGMSNKKVHVIFNYKGENHLTKKTIRCKVSQVTRSSEKHALCQFSHFVGIVASARLILMDVALLYLFTF